MTFDQVKLSSVLALNTDFVDELEDQNYKRLSVRLYGNGIEVGEVVHANSIVMKKHQIVKTGQVVLSMMWGKKGAIGVVPDSCDGGIITTNFYLFDINISKIETTFLNWIFRANYLEEQLMAVARGTASNATTRPKQLLECLIPLPPLTEQRRIVTRIEALAARVTAAQSLRREAYNETNLLINSYLNTFANNAQEKYKTVFLEDLMIDANYGTSVKCQPERTDDSIPVLRIPNVASEKVSLNDMKYGVLTKTEYKKTVLQEGDILVVRTNGSIDLVGRCAVVPVLPEPMAFASYMIRIKCDKKIVSPEFLQLVLRQQRTGGFLIDFARTTAGQYNVSLGRLRKTKIPVPPLPEQRRLVVYLDGLQAQVTSLRAAQAESERELSALMPSVLDRAFKGEL